MKPNFSVFMQILYFTLYRGKNSFWAKAATAHASLTAAIDTTCTGRALIAFLHTSTMIRRPISKITDAFAFLSPMLESDEEAMDLLWKSIYDVSFQTRFVTRTRTIAADNGITLHTKDLFSSFANFCTDFPSQAPPTLLYPYKPQP